MKRRSVIQVPAVAALGAALPLFAQTQRLMRMGLVAIVPDTDPVVAPVYRVFWGELRRLGWEEGRNLLVERAFAGPSAEQFPAMVQDLVRKGLDVILTASVFPTIVAARATQTIPIVFTAVDEPVARGLVDSLARPGRNLTGFTLFPGYEFIGKVLQFLREIAPTAKRLSWLTDIPIPDTLTMSGAATNASIFIESAARQMGFELRLHAVRRQEDLARALADIAAWPADVMVSGVIFLATAQGQRLLADFALRHRIASMIPPSTGVEAGALISYAIAPSEFVLFYVRAAGYVDRILRGAKAADLPVEPPSRFELLINLKTAKAIGVTVPQSLLIRADRVIE